MLPELPEEITFFHILPRLPGKSLMRFRCVCKSWSALTRNPLFIETHRDFNCNNHTNLLLATWDPAAQQQNFFSVQIDQEGSALPGTNHLLNLQTSVTKYRFVQKAQAINGLVCLSFPHMTPPDRSKLGLRVHLFNPCTQESIVLPYSPPLPRTFQEAYHFGFCPSTNEYKVLQMKKSFYNDMTAGSSSTIVYSIQIFKLGTDFWREIDVDHNDLPFDLQKCCFHNRSVYIHGAIHWMHGTQNLIVVFDLKDERFGVIPFPRGYGYRANHFSSLFGSTVEVGGCLTLIDDKESEQDMLKLWVLKDYKNQVWVRETIIFPLYLAVSPFRPVLFGTIHTGELLLQSSSSVRLDSASVRVYLYNIKSRSFRTIEIILPEWIHPSYVIKLKLLPSYIDSIVPLRL